MIHCVRLRFEKSSPRWRILGRKPKILLVEFFNFREVSPEFGVQRRTQDLKKDKALLKTEARSTGHAQKCIEERMNGVGRPINREQHRTNKSDQQPGRSSKTKTCLCITSGWPPGQSTSRTWASQLAVDRTMVLRCFLFGFYILFWSEFRSIGF